MLEVDEHFTADSCLTTSLKLFFWVHFFFFLLVNLKCLEINVCLSEIILVKESKIRFTKHALEKFEFVRRFGFVLEKR